MDKKQFKLQVMHNRFIRNAVSTFCWSVIASIAYTFILSLISATTKYSNSEPTGAYVGAIILSLGYLTFIIIMISGLISDNHKIREVEEEFFSDRKVKVVYKYVEKPKDTDIEEDSEDL